MDEASKIEEIIDQVTKISSSFINCQKTNTILRKEILKLFDVEEVFSDKQKILSVQEKLDDEVQECSGNEKVTIKSNSADARTALRDFQNYEKMLAERIRENIKLQEQNYKLQKECKSKDRKISDLTRKLNLKVSEFEKKNIEAVKSAQYKDIIGSKNIELQKLKKELEIEKRRVEKEQCTIKRMHKLEQIKRQQIEKSRTHCNAMQIERHLKELQDSRDKLARELGKKTEECNSAFAYITVLEEESTCMKSELDTVHYKEKDGTNLFQEALNQLKAFCEANKLPQYQRPKEVANLDSATQQTEDKYVQVDLRSTANEQHVEGTQSSALLDKLPVSKCSASVPAIRDASVQVLPRRPVSRSTSNFANSKARPVRMKSKQAPKRSASSKLQLKSVEEEMSKTRNILVSRICHLEERINSIPLDAIAKCFSQNTE